MKITINKPEFLTDKIKKDILANGISNATELKADSTKAVVTGSVTNNAKVDISAEGMMKSQSSVIKREESSKPDVRTRLTKELDAGLEYSDHFKSLLDDIKNGKEISEKESKWLNGELQNMSAKTYSILKDFRINDDEIKVLKDLQDNYKKRQRIFEDMLKQVEDDLGQQLTSDSTKMLLAAMDKKDKERLIEILSQSLEEDEEVKQDEDENAEEGNDLETPVEENNGVKAADKMIDHNIALQKEISNQSNMEFANSRKADILLDNTFIRTEQVLMSDNIDIATRVDSFEQFKENGKELTLNREIEKAKAIFDRETALVADINFQGHNDLSEVIKAQNKFYSNQLGKNFILSFLK